MGVSLFNGLPDDSKQKRIMFLTDVQVTVVVAEAKNAFSVLSSPIIEPSSHSLFGISLRIQ